MTKQLNARELLIDILKWRRPHGSNTVVGFARKYLQSIGAKRDPFGNYILVVPGGVKNNILWSSHIDTVHRVEGHQNVLIKDDVVYVATSSSNCLGADCSTGVALMLQMIEYNVPGSYVFHAGEERGCLGSKFLKASNPEWLKEHTHAIAFDRRGYSSVITHQMGVNTASKVFADSFIQTVGLIEFLKPDPTGLFTDTYQYEQLIPECSNISVGYENEHSREELQNLRFYELLLECLLTADWDKLEIGEREKDTWGSYGNYGWMGHAISDHIPLKQEKDDYKKNLIQDNWDIVLSILEATGLDWETEIYRNIGWEPKRVSVS